MASRAVPWLRLNVTVFQETKVQLAGCGAVYPWMLARVKLLGNGTVTRMDMHPKLAARDLSIPVDIAHEQIEGAFEFGLFTEADDGSVTVDDWHQFQIDPRPNSRYRKKKTSPKQSRSTPGTPRDVPGTPHPSPGDVPIGPWVDNDYDKDRSTPLTPLGGGAAEEQGSAGTPPKRQVAGVEHYTAQGLKLRLIPIWPIEWHRPNAGTFLANLAKFPASVVDAAITEATSKGHDKPWILKTLCQKYEKKAQAGAESGQKIQEEAMRQQLRRMEQDPAEVHALAQDCLAAKVRPPNDEVRRLIVRWYETEGLSVPELFRGDP